MEYIDILEVVAKIGAFIRAQNAQRQADKGPNVHNSISLAIVFAQLMDLSMAVMAACDTVIRACGLDLLVFYPAVFQTGLVEPGLQKAASAAAAEVVGAVGIHFDKIFFTHNRLDHKTQIVGYGISIGLAYDLAGVLDRELNFKVFVPVGIDLEFAFADPLGVIFIYIFYDKVVLDVEFFQSCQD